MEWSIRWGETRIAPTRSPKSDEGKKKRRRRRDEGDEAYLINNGGYGATSWKGEGAR